jgi:hypothetical protein
MSVKYQFRLTEEDQKIIDYLENANDGEQSFLIRNLLRLGYQVKEEGINSVLIPSSSPVIQNDSVDTVYYNNGKPSNDNNLDDDDLETRLLSNLDNIKF